MSERHLEESVLRSYLLGELAEPEQEAVEAAYLRQPELFDELVALEDELLDELVAGRLAPGQARTLERRLARAADGRERLRLARLLAGRSALAPRVRPGGRGLPGWAWAAALLLCAGLCGWLAWRARTLERELRVAQAAGAAQARQAAAAQAVAGDLRAELERERREAEALEERARARQPAAIVRLILAAGLSRSAQEPAAVRLPPDAAALHLLLELDDEPLPSYSAALQTPEGRTLWSQIELRPRPAGGKQVVVFHVPAERLAPGDYVVQLQGAAAQGALEAAGDYTFRIRR